MAEQIERTLALIKPDAVELSLDAKIMALYVNAGLKIVESKVHRMTSEEAAAFYAEHAEKSFFDGLVEFMTSGELVVLVLEGENAVRRVRELNGATKPEDAGPESIRGMFMCAGGPRNLVHGSDSPEAFRREFAILFPDASPPD